MIAAGHDKEYLPMQGSRGVLRRDRGAAARERRHPAIAEKRVATIQVRSISHWSPYDRVGVVNAVP